MAFLLNKRHPGKAYAAGSRRMYVCDAPKIVSEPCRFLNALHVVWIGRCSGASMRPDPNDIASRPLSTHNETESVHDLRRWICRRGAYDESRDLQEIC